MNDATYERWLPVVGFEGFYEVSSASVIKSLPRKTRVGVVGGGILKPQKLPKGYLQVTLSVNNVQTRRYVHRIVAEAFLGPCPEGEEVRHKDGDPANNAASNLVYGTHPENMQDMVDHGRSIAGTRHPFTKFTDADILAIREAWQRGERGVDLAARYSTSPAAISRLVNGVAYRDGEVLVRPRGDCHFPGCGRLAREGTDGHGKALVFCEDPGHNNEGAKRERSRLQHLNRIRPEADCPQCGTRFTLRRSDAIYCSRDCKVKAYQAKAKALRQETLLPPRCPGSSSTTGIAGIVT